jgi:hypothetical protein
MPEQEREMSEKWTPGPWIWSGLQLLASRKMYSEAVMIAEDEPFSPSMADRHLIAAAPDLYEALADGKELISGDLVGVEWKQACAAFLDKARLALSRARGE